MANKNKVACNYCKNEYGEITSFRDEELLLDPRLIFQISQRIEKAKICLKLHRPNRLRNLEEIPLTLHNFSKFQPSNTINHFLST